MAILKNMRHELFAQGVARGLPASTSYKRAGFHNKGAAQSASLLLTKAKIQKRIKELKSRLVKKLERHTIIDKAWVVDQLVDNIMKAKQDIPVYDRKGNPTGEYVFQGNIVNKALELVGKELGMFRDRIEHTGLDGSPIQMGHKLDLSSLSDKDLELLESAGVKLKEAYKAKNG